MSSTNNSQTPEIAKYGLANATTGGSTAAKANLPAIIQGPQTNSSSTALNPNETAEEAESDAIPSSLATEIREKAKKLNEKEQSLTRFHNLLRDKNEDQYNRKTAIVAREEAVGLFSGRFIQGEKKKSKPRKIKKKTRSTKDGVFLQARSFRSSLCLVRKQTARLRRGRLLSESVSRMRHLPASR